jgi:anti-anti-sigma factor
MNATEPRGPAVALAVTTVADGDAVWVRICGEVDLVTREALRLSLARLEFGKARLVFLDVGQLTFCDGVGCHMLARFRKRTVAAGYDVRFIHASPIIRRVMDLIGEEAN